MEIDQKFIDMRDYIRNLEQMTFCAMKDFDGIVRKEKKECKQSIEEFYLQSMLVEVNEDKFAIEEVLTIEDERLQGLEKLLYSLTPSSKEQYIIKAIDIASGLEIISPWLSEKELNEINLNLEELKNIYILEKQDIADLDELILEDEEHLYFYSRYLYG